MTQDIDIIIKDKVHNYINEHFEQNKKTIVVLNEIIFYSIFIYYYYFGPLYDSNQTFLIVKFTLIILAIRYLFNYITSYNVNKNNYYQLNSKIAIFSIFILFLTNTNNNSLHNLTTLLLILTYALLSSCAQYGYTVDNITTILITYSLFKSNLIN